MLLPIYLLVVCFLAWAFSKFLNWRNFKKRRIGVFVFVLALMFISVADHLVGEIIGRYWVGQSINPPICMNSQWSFFLPIDDEFCATREERLGLKREVKTSDEVDKDLRLNQVDSPRYMKNLQYEHAKWMKIRDENYESDFKMNLSAFALRNKMSEFDVDDSVVLKNYRFKIFKNANIASCLENVDGYFYEKYKNTLPTDRQSWDRHFIENEKECLDIQIIDEISDRYVKSNSNRSFFLFGFHLHDRMQRRLVDSITGEVIYDKRKVRSDGGWFVKFILADPVSGGYGRGYQYGFIDFQ